MVEMMASFYTFTHQLQNLFQLRKNLIQLRSVSVPDKTCQ